MKKILFLIMLLILPIYTSALTYPTLHYKSALIYDMTDNKLLYELNTKEQRSIASLTKIVTTITALESITNLTDEVTITNDMLSKVRWDASIAGLKAGQTYTYEDLLYASILPSGADATISLAISTSGSIENFVKKMNDLTDRIGMTNSNFVNVHGLDEKGHYSTAEDIHKLLMYCLKNPKFKEIYTTKEYQLSTGKIVKSTVKTLHVTGLPYKMSVNPHQDLWSFNGGIAKFEAADQIVLKEAKVNSARLTFAAESKINVFVNVERMQIYTPSLLGIPNIVVSVAGVNIQQYTGDKGTAKTKTINNISLPATITGSNSSIEFTRNYKYLTDGWINFKNVSVLYR
jgi:hypothetical protein